MELVGRIRTGDAAAFEALYRQHATRLYNLAIRMMGRGDADDGIILSAHSHGLADGIFVGEERFGHIGPEHADRAAELDIARVEVTASRERKIETREIIFV